MEEVFSGASKRRDGLRQEEEDSAKGREDSAEEEDGEVEVSFDVQQPQLPSMKNKWSCDVCLLINDSTRSVCAACSNPKSGSTEKHTPVSQLSHLTPVPGSWVCDTCLVNNKMANINCIACKTSKPGTGSSTKQSSIFQPLQLSHLAPAPGSWTCDTCLLSNKMVDNSCIACKNPKPGTTAIVSQSCPPPAPLKVTFPSITPSSPQLQPSSGGVKLDILKTSPLSSMVPSGFAAISQPIGAGGFHLGGLKLGSGDSEPN